MFHDDEELARSGQVGVLVHATIGTLAARTRCPSPTDLRAAADRALGAFAPIEARAHRQNVAALSGSYFWHLLPPATWIFAGTELDVGVGRVDLVWRDSGDRVLIDEIKTGSPRELGLARTTAQVRRYLDCATQLWPDRFIGIRLLSLTEPHRSVLVRPDGSRVPLHRSPYLTAKK
ncbi:PD-(D/E)XK nuclease family protein [Geodermatophilus sp. CPCC 205506]|uniref:PD-(D/E)XK nuclease family protein n=1 Tax=Geodermatophilus sp. CPCC 205506 TaxID=2936596 RepID=UPI003EED6603